MKHQHRAGTLLQGPELSRMQRKLKGKVKWIRTFNDGAYLVLFMDGSKLYRPSRTWLRLHSLQADRLRRSGKFKDRIVPILYNAREESWVEEETRKTQYVTIISQTVISVPLPIMQWAERFTSKLADVMFPVKPSNS